MFAPEPALTPAEAMLLLDLRRAAAAGLFKVTAMALLLRRVLRAETETRRGWFRARTITRLHLGQVPGLPLHEAAVVRLVRPAGDAQPGNPTVEQVVAAARRQYGPDLGSFRKKLVLPALTERGLVEVQAGGLFGLKRPVLTPAGTTEWMRLQALLDRGRMVPHWLDSDPRQAALAAAALGPLVLLVDELKPHLKRLAAAMPRQAGDCSPMADGGDADHGRHHGGDPGAEGLGASSLDQGSFDHSGFDFGAFDFGAWDGAGFDVGLFDALDSAISSFDAATDGGHDGGGDSGGSDSGGGGGE